MQLIDDIPVWGDLLETALQQIRTCRDEKTAGAALMADHHQGYSMPIGGVIAYPSHVSPSGVGYDIACGNKAVLLDVAADDLQANLSLIMDEIYSAISFGVGRKNQTQVEHILFDDDPAWDIEIVAGLRQLAQSQLGTVGSGNHFVDLLTDEQNRIWVGVHFGSRGFGHKIATHYIQAGGGKDGIFAEPVTLSVNEQLGQEYLAAMQLAGRYAYAGRDWVCQKVADIIGANIVDEVHNHHNFAWREQHENGDFWVVRKGATPAWPGQRGFVGGTMGDLSVIVAGKDVTDESRLAFQSTIHGAGRIMSRTKAAGKFRWKRIDGKRRRVKKADGVISRGMMLERLGEVELRGAGTDESPQCYKQIEDVLAEHQNTIDILHSLKPLGVAMAGVDEFEPYKD